MTYSPYHTYSHSSTHNRPTVRGLTRWPHDRWTTRHMNEEQKREPFSFPHGTPILEVQVIDSYLLTPWRSLLVGKRHGVRPCLGAVACDGPEPEPSCRPPDSSTVRYSKKRSDQLVSGGGCRGVHAECMAVASMAGRVHVGVRPSYTTSVALCSSSCNINFCVWARFICSMYFSRYWVVFWISSSAIPL